MASAAPCYSGTPSLSSVTNASSDEIAVPLELIRAPIRKIYIPAGFDDNDLVQIFVEGQFPNNCYQDLPAQFYIDHENQRIYFDVLAYKYDGDCSETSKTAWMQPINLKVLKKGTYKIYRETQNLREPNADPMGELSIAHTNSRRRDDFVYAPVDSMIIKSPRSSPATRKVVIAGTYENNCLELDRENSRITHSKDVIVIQPVTRQIQGKSCQDEETPFVEELDLPGAIPQGRYLFHVRTKDGHSFNKVSFLPAGS